MSFWFNSGKDFDARAPAASLDPQDDYDIWHKVALYAQVRRASIQVLQDLRAKYAVAHPEYEHQGVGVFDDRHVARAFNGHTPHTDVMDYLSGATLRVANKRSTQALARGCVPGAETASGSYTRPVGIVDCRVRTVRTTLVAACPTPPTVAGPLTPAPTLEIPSTCNSLPMQ